MTTILLLGKSGQVGHELSRTLAPLGTLISPDHAQIELLNPDSIQSVILQSKPDVIVNAAGVTIVDAAEQQPDLAMKINGEAPSTIATLAQRIGALLVHFSTTFVFDGTKRTPYTEDDQPNPINAYGRSKLAGEQAIQACCKNHIILRANWTYSSRRTNFALRLLELARLRSENEVVDDQIGAPTWARAYAEATATMLGNLRHLREKCGTYNLSASGHCTRFQWAERLVEAAKLQSNTHDGWGKLTRTTTDRYVNPAQRPLYTVTDNRKIRELLGIELKPWDIGTSEFIRDHFQNVDLETKH